MENQKAKQDSSKEILRDVIQTFLLFQGISLKRNPTKAIEIVNKIIDGQEVKKNQEI